MDDFGRRFALGTDRMKIARTIDDLEPIAVWAVEEELRQVPLSEPIAIWNPSRFGGWG